MGRDGLGVRVVATCRPGIAGRHNVGDPLRGRLLRQARNTCRFGAGEICFATAETLAHHVGEVVVDDVCLGQVDPVSRVGRLRDHQLHKGCGCDRACPRSVEYRLHFLASAQVAGIVAVHDDLRGRRLVVHPIVEITHILEVDIGAPDYRDLRGPTYQRIKVVNRVVVRRAEGMETIAGGELWMLPYLGLCGKLLPG